MATRTVTPFEQETEKPFWRLDSAELMETCTMSPEPDDGVCDLFTRGRFHDIDGTVVACCCACAFRIVELRKVAQHG